MRESSSWPDVRMPSASRRCSGSSRVRSSRSSRPSTPLSGVRISWLTVARKSDFCCEAAIAASRASASESSASSRASTCSSCWTTWSTIPSISSNCSSGGVAVITPTACTRPRCLIGKARETRSSSHSGTPLRAARVATASSRAARSGWASSSAISRSRSSATGCRRVRVPPSTRKATARSQSSIRSSRSRPRPRICARLLASLAALATPWSRSYCDTFSASSARAWVSSVRVARRCE